MKLFGHFAEILNRSRPDRPAVVSEPERKLDISIEAPTISEIVKAMKNEKAPEDDQLNPDFQS